ncbi:MAG: sulfite exporter TauE/SafE family protein, partial [Acidobacteriota bacterium]
MTNAVILLLLILFFFTSAIGVVTGSNSLITVPVMFQFGIDEKVAVATNMFGLTFMAVGGAIPFVRQNKIEIGRIMPMIVLTIVSSAIGAALVGLITDQGIKLMVSIAMIAIAAFTLFRPDAGIKTQPAVGGRLALSYSIVFLLGIYGGLYSGGYVTILTSVLVVFFGMTFSESVAATKVINVFSSLIASIVF